MTTPPPLPSLNDLATPQELAYLRAKRFAKHELAEPVFALKRVPGGILAMIVDHWEYEETVIELDGHSNPGIFPVGDSRNDDTWDSLRGWVVGFIYEVRDGYWTTKGQK